MERAFRRGAVARASPKPTSPRPTRAFRRLAVAGAAQRHVDEAAAWTAEEAWRERRSWERGLSRREYRELEDATARILDSPLQLEEANSELDPRDWLSPQLLHDFQGIRRELLRGRGFALIRNVPVDLCKEQKAVVGLLLGRSFGQLRPQNKHGHLLGHVQDLGLNPMNPSVRIYATKAAQPPHTDSADIVGLLCCQPAIEGGLTSFASSVSIFRELEAECPRLATLLTQPFFVDRKGEVPEGEAPFYELAIYHRTPREGRMVCICDRSFITAAQRWDEVPRLTPEQELALDALEAKATSDHLRVDMMLEPGDFQLLHSHQTLHFRSEFRDDPEKPRHLLRLWMCPADGIELPPPFARRYGTIEVGRRGGLPCKRHTVPLEAC